MPGVSARSLLSVLGAAALGVVGTIAFVGWPLRANAPLPAAAAAAPAAVAPPPGPLQIEPASSEALVAAPAARAATSSPARPPAARARETSGTRQRRNESPVNAQPKILDPSTSSTPDTAPAAARRGEPKRPRPRRIGPLEKDL